jgi:hypothetical protein
MSAIPTFVCNWIKWFRVLRSVESFNFIGAVRHGLWLARS